MVATVDYSIDEIKDKARHLVPAFLTNLAIAVSESFV